MPYQRCWAEISLDAVEANIAAIKARLAPGVKLMCSIKADGYGHGALALARFLDGKCDYFAVAILEEALKLRDEGIAKPVLLLGYTSPSQYDQVIAAKLTQAIFSLGQAQLLSQAAQPANAQALIHIAVDTGMGRIGFADTDESIEAIIKIAALPHIIIEGLFTHFARADETDKTSALSQYGRFDAFIEKLEAAGIKIPIKHACNSAAVIEFGKHYDLVRIGIAMYGLYPSGEVDKTALPLRPAMTWKTRVTHLKTVPAGTGISYGHTFVTSRETRVATLPVGYADGYPRALSNKGRVLIRGRFAPIIGRICMDQCMADVTGIPGIEIEDEATLLGGEITMEEIAALSGTINYEAACRISARVPRIYK